MTTELDVAREALAQIGTRSKIVSLDDGSAEAQYVKLLYGPLRDFLLREGDYDWSMGVVSAVPTGPIIPPWNFSYEYPEFALRVRQLVPADFDPIDPRPVSWNVLPLSAVNIICTQVAIGTVIVTQPVIEDRWDAMFRESFVRFLASSLAFALENRIEASKEKMEEALSFAGIANLRDS